MSDEPTNTVPPLSHDATGKPETNGTPAEQPAELGLEVVMLRARCSNLRHWCRLMLEDPASAGVLPDSTVAELLSVAPEVTELEGHLVVALLAHGGSVPPNHPLASGSIAPTNLKTSIACLSTERERLLQAFFALFDHLHPGDDLTEDYLLEQRAKGPMPLMGEVLADLEREFGMNPS